MKNNRNVFLAVVAVVLLLAVAFYHEGGNSFTTDDLETLRETRFLMDTVVTMQVIAENPQESIDEAFSVMEKVIHKANRFEEDSVVYRINQSAGDGYVDVDPDVFEIIQIGKEEGLNADGLFTILIAPLMDLWGFGQGTDWRVPDEEAIEEVLPLISLDNIHLDTEHKRVKLEQGASLDLGGVAKGYVVDRGMEVLIEQGAHAAFINAGGDIRVHGRKLDDTPWRIGIRDPRKSSHDYLSDYVLHMEGGAVVTSGDYERYFEEDGVAYNHILDPRTGFPSREVRSTTVVGPSAMVADVYSTALFVMDVERGLHWIEGIDGYEALLVTDEGIFTTSGFEKYVP